MRTKFQAVLVAASFVAACGGGEPEPRPADNCPFDPSCDELPADASVLDGSTTPPGASTDTTAPPTIRAGQLLVSSNPLVPGAVNVACWVVDASGRNAVPGADVVVEYEYDATPDEAIEDVGVNKMAKKVGTVAIKCVVHQDLNGNGDNMDDSPLVDPTPAIATIVPGDADETIASVDHSTIDPGGTVNVSCAVQDAFGNAITGATPTIELQPSLGSSGSAITIDRAGEYKVYCRLPGVTTETPATITVGTGGATTISAAVSPPQGTYAVGQRITIDAVAKDASGNVIADATFAYASDIAMDGAGPQFIIANPGRHHVTVALATDNTVSTRVDFTAVDPADCAPGASCPVPCVRALDGAACTCDASVPPVCTMPAVSPPVIIGNPGGDPDTTNDDTDGAEATDTGGVVYDDSGVLEVPSNRVGLDGGVTGNYTFSGQILIPRADVDRVTVNGVNVDIIWEPDGRYGTFTASLDPRWGINFVEVIIYMKDGSEFSRVFSYLVSGDWVDPFGQLASSVALKLRQPFIDDEVDTDDDSLNDLVYSVINSEGIGDLLTTAIQPMNPLVPSVCRVTLFGTCILWSKPISFISADFGTGNEIAMDLIEGGMTLTLDLARPVIKLDVGGGNEMWGTLRDTRIQMTLNIGYAGGRPKITLRTLDSVNIGYVDLDAHFNGVLSDFFASILTEFIQFLFQGLLQQMVENALADRLDVAITTALDGLFAGMTTVVQAGTQELTGLNGTTTVKIFTALLTDHTSATENRLMIGLSSLVAGVDIGGRNPRRTPLPPSPVRPYDPASASAVTVSIYAGILDQYLHAMWQAGYFDGTIALADADGSLAGAGLYGGGGMNMTAGLPPVFWIRPDGVAELQIGSFMFDMDDGSGGRTQMMLGAVLEATLAVESGENGKVSFTGVTIRDLIVSPFAPSLVSSATRQILADAMRPMLQETLSGAIGTAMPGLPLPAFDIPERVGEVDLAALGLPAGERITLVIDPTMLKQEQHIVLRGPFGFGDNTQLSTDCEDVATCGDCTTVALCGWCASSEQCVNGGPTGPSSGSCRGDWVFGNDLMCGS